MDDNEDHAWHVEPVARGTCEWNRSVGPSKAVAKATPLAVSSSSPSSPRPSRTPPYGADEVSSCNDAATVTAAAQLPFSDDGRELEFLPGALTSAMLMLKAFRQAGRYCDVKCRTSGGGEILAHRFVLAARNGGCRALFTEVCEALETVVGSEQRELVNFAKWPPISEVLASDLRTNMLELAVDIAYNVPLQDLVGPLNVLEVTEVLGITALRDHCVKLLGEGLNRETASAPTSWP